MNYLWGEKYEPKYRSIDSLLLFQRKQIRHSRYKLTNWNKYRTSFRQINDLVSRNVKNCRQLKQQLKNNKTQIHLHLRIIKITKKSEERENISRNNRKTYRNPSIRSNRAAIGRERPSALRRNKDGGKEQKGISLGFLVPISRARGLVSRRQIKDGRRSERVVTFFHFTLALTASGDFGAQTNVFWNVSRCGEAGFPAV